MGTPLRKCIGCGKMIEKPQLLRVVMNTAGEFMLDQRQKSEGRGAYLCRNAECFAKAVKGRGLERSFKGRVPQDIYEQLEGEVSNDPR